MGKQLDYDILIDHLRRMMEARQIDRLPKSGYAKAIEDVAGCPTAEPKRGRWIDEHCSECGVYVFHGDADNYCPHCGARMDGDDDA